MSRKLALRLDSSFLSFPPQPSPRTEFFNRHIRSTTTTTTSGKVPTSPNKRLHLQVRNEDQGQKGLPQTSLPRHRPSPLDLYDLPTLEALPTPPPSSSKSASYRSSLQQGIGRPRRLKKTPSQGEMGGPSLMRPFARKNKDKDKDMFRDQEKDNWEQNKDKDRVMDKDNQSSFLPFDDPPPSATRRPSTPLARPAGMANSSRPRPRPAPLDPSIFGHHLQVVKAEDPIDMVLRLDKEEKTKAISRSFSPFSNISGPVHPLPLDPSIFGHTLTVVRSEDPIDMVLRLENEEQKRALKQSFSPFQDDATPSSRKPQRPRGQTQSYPTPARIPESKNGSLRQRHQPPLPSILGVIEGDQVDPEKRGTMQLPIMHPPPSGRDHLQRIPSRPNGRSRQSPPSSAASTPREYFYPRPESPRVAYRDHSLPTTNRPGTAPINATVDESPTLGSIHLPSVNRHISLTPSTASISEHAWRSSAHVEADPEDELLTALEILEELHGGMEDGWEFGILAKERTNAGMDRHSVRQKNRVISPEPEVVSHHRSSIKEVANSVRSWRESRKKNKDGRPASEQGHGHGKAGSIKPKHSVDGLQPLHEVHYTVERDIVPPPIPPRAPGRSLPPLRMHVERVMSGKSGVEIPIVLDSPAKSGGFRESMETIRRDDIPQSVALSPPTSPTPIHQQPLPPIPGLLPLAKPLNRLLQARPKRLSTGEQPQSQRVSSPISFSEPASPLDSPPRSLPRPRLSAREEPHAGLSPRPTPHGTFSVDRAQSRKHGMTALSFLALDDPTQSWAKASTATDSDRVSLEGSRRRESVQAHIIPPEELAKLITRRRRSSESGKSRDSTLAHEVLDEEDNEQVGKVGRMSFGLSPPPRHHRRSFEPPPRVEEEAPRGSLSPPPRPRPLHPTRRPSDSPSTSSRPYLHIEPSCRLPHTPSPTPSHAFSSVARSQYSTPSPHKSTSTAYNDYDHPFLAYSPQPSTMGHAAELKHDTYYPDPASPVREVEVEKQALSDWLSQPRVRKASVPVNGFVRRRDLGIVV